MNGRDERSTTFTLADATAEPGQIGFGTAI